MRLKAKSRGSAFIRLNNDTTRCAPCVNVVLFVCVCENKAVFHHRVSLEKKGQEKHRELEMMERDQQDWPDR